ncbi:BA14K family protein [Ochrobactrum teleogrylli]|uniref:Lectin-like protein BA14k n=1 Tax=Ochrobactrum teleogrylli TaxID=2479765 RepID=A0ABY2Y7T8_9HYPH|nr:BA14K family protein [[Ochrobactrum] teleogrylli]TNV16977.1 BA14K family protein [[Ochrobactrum] teleogrylli]
MKRFGYSVVAACLSLGIGLSAAAGTANAAQPSLMAAPTTAPAQASAPTAQTVQYYDYRDDRRYWRYDRPRYRPYYRHDRRYWGPGPAYRPAPTYRSRNPHTRWCYSRYRSYRAYDNTFQPNYGPRRQCYSPYL